MHFIKRDHSQLPPLPTFSSFKNRTLDKLYQLPHLKLFTKISTLTVFIGLFFSLPFIVPKLTDNESNQALDVAASRYTNRFQKRWTPRPTVKPTIKPTTRPTSIPSAAPSQSPIPSSPSASPLINPSPTASDQAFCFGVVEEDYLNKTGILASLSTILSTQICSISIYKQFGNVYNADFDLTPSSYVAKNNIKVQLAWEPWNPEEGMNQSTDYLSTIPTGADDEYLSSVAESIKAYDSPVVLRFGHEMNGDWYPWGRRPSEYVAAYRYIHDFFATEGVTNVTWEWSVNVDIDGNPATLAAYYPGDDYVDLIGIDGFNFGTSLDYGGWQSFTSVFAPTYQYLVKNYRQPLIISETASAEAGGNKSTWIKNMFTTELPKTFPEIHEVIWFDLLKETDWRIDSTKTSLQSFTNGLALPIYKTP